MTLVNNVLGFASTILPEKSEDEIFVWIDFLCRQVDPKGRPATGAEMIQETRAAIAKCTGPTLLNMDANGDVFNVTWIQYELWCTHFLKGGDQIRLMCDELLDPSKATDLLSLVDPCEANCLSESEREAVVKDLESAGALNDFQNILCRLLYDASMAEVAHMREVPDVAQAHLASALHKAGIFALGCELLDAAEVSPLLIDHD